MIKKKTSIVLTLALIGLCITFGLAYGLFSKSIPERSIDTKVMPPYLQKLQTASKFYGRYTGSDGGQTDDFLAYDEALSHGATIRRELERIVSNGSPSGKLYAAILIQHFDPQAGLQALKKIESEKIRDRIGFNSYGCCVYNMPASDVASLLVQQPTVRTEWFEKKRN